jgi:hypothetical protein
MDLVFADHLIPKIVGKEKKNGVIKCIMIQSTGSVGDTSDTFYNNYDNQPDKRMAHYVVGKDHVVKYMYSGQSIFINSEKFTDKANTLFKNKDDDKDDPGLHIIAIEVCLDSEYNLVEKNLVRFLGEFLIKYGLDVSNLWRRHDIVYSDDDKNYNPQYPNNADWNKLLVCINAYIEELRKPEPNFDNVTTTGVTIPDQWPTYESDSRNVPTLKSADVTELSKEDYTITRQGDVDIKTDRFTSRLDIVTGGNTYEPIYPDLTVPPRSTPNLYDKAINNIKDEKSSTKPVLGKMVNNTDPYPIDQKIIELGYHYPIVHIEEGQLGDISDPTIIAAYLVSLSSRTEKRLSQLENILGTTMRYLYRLSSRININCVYYGGQNAFGKYDGIRCMNDDLVSDGKSVTLDQCINCARYEPILGQVYDILDENMKVGLGPILDDAQMARMTMEEHIQFSRLEEMSNDSNQANSKLDELNKKRADDKAFDDLMPTENVFTMDWTETPFEKQTPDINEYSYSPVNILKDKDNRLKPENKYKDGYDEVVKKKIVVPQDSYNISGIGGAGGGGMSDYDFSNAQVRLEIIKLALHVVELGGKEEVLYMQGPKIPENEMDKEPEDLIAERGGILYLDCSHFMKYVHVHNGIKYGETTYDQFPKLQVIGEIGNLEASMEAAVPGDIVFYGTSSNIHHTALYLGKEDGKGMIAQAANSHIPKNRQINKAEITNLSDFYAMCRVPGVPVPVKKAMNMTNSKEFTGDGSRKVPVAYVSWILDAARQSNISPSILAGIIDIESSWNPNAVNASTGATGFGQFLLTTAESEGLMDRTDPKESIYHLASYLRKRIDWAGGDIEKGIMGYGEGTQTYLDRVLNAAKCY